MIESIAFSLGLPVMAFKLLVSLLAGYGFGGVQRYIMSKRGEGANHLYSLAVGVSLALFNYGIDAWHSFFCIVATWALLKSIKGISLAVPVVFAFNFGYLVVCYYCYATDEYDINFTTAHCVLTLRLIGFAFDVNDGRRLKLFGDDAKLSDGQMARALPHMPGVVPMLGYCYHYSGFLIGPQFPYLVYERYVRGTLHKDANGRALSMAELPSGVAPALKSLALGVLYLALYEACNSVLPTSKMMSDEFLSAHSFVGRWLSLTVWGKLALMKYLGIWKFGEGSGILCGLGYQVDARTGEHNWKRLANVSLLGYETSANLREVVRAFNINTNDWMKNYVFVRLAPRIGYQSAGLAVLLFLAIWHGFDAGYFLCFVTEFVDLDAEKRLMRWFMPLKNRIFGAPIDERRGLHDPHSGGLAGYLYSLAGYWLRSAAMAYGFVPFELLSLSATMRVWSHFYFSSHLFFVAILLLDLFVVQKANKKATAKE
jgi:lysophospholipid acyltransferase 5